MKDADRLGRFKSRNHLENGIHCLRRKQRPFALHQVLKRAAGNKLHRDDWCAVDFLRAIDINAVGMIDGSSEASLPQKAFARVGRIKLLAQHFERDIPSALEVLSLVHRAHAAVSKLAHNPVVAELLTRLRQLAGQDLTGGYHDGVFRHRLGGQRLSHEAFGTKSFRRGAADQFSTSRTFSNVAHLTHYRSNSLERLRAMEDQKSSIK